MKAVKLLAFVTILFALQSCYTVIWTPDVAFPSKEKSEESDSYYDDVYYSPYYDIPWWYTIPPPPTYTPLVNERDAQTTKLRNGSEPGRGTPERPNIPERTPVVEQPVTTPPPTVSQPVTGEDASAKKTESTPPQRERGNSSNSRDTRNNDGSRSSDTPRR